MRVALLIDSLEGGGSEGVVRRLAYGLAERGQHVFIHCLKAAGREVWAHPNLTVIEHRSRGRDLRLPLRLARAFCRDRVEIVHAHSCAALCVAWPAARFLGIPIVHVRHGWPVSGPERYARWAERLAPWIDGIVINSEAGRLRLANEGVRRSAVHIPNGVDCAAVDRAEARRQLEAFCAASFAGPVVLSVANLRPEKDHITLLRSFARLREQFSTAELVCVGAARNAEYARRVMEERERLDLKLVAHFPGAHDDAARLMTGADVFCVSSVSDAMPNVVLEAMAQRVPIVATGVGDIGRVGVADADLPFMLRDRETALLAPPQDAAALAERLNEALAERAATVRRAHAALSDYMERFSTRKMVERYESLYRDLLTTRQNKSTRKQGHWGRAPSRPAVLVVGPAAPQVGGMVTAIETLMSGPLRDQFELVRHATPEPRGALRLREFPSLLRAVMRHAGAAWRLAATIRQRRVRLVHIHTCSYVTWHRNMVDALIARLLGCRVVLHVRGGRFEEFCRGAGPMQRRIIQMEARLAQSVVVLSEETAHSLRDYLPGVRVEVVPNGVAIEPLAVFGPRVPDCRFLFLGAPTESKGILELLAAAERLHREGTRFRLLIVVPMDDRRRDTLKRELTLRDLDSIVELRDTVTARERSTLFAGVDCLVHPSHSEAMPNTVLEAGAAGLCVIATDVGCVAEMLRAGASPGVGEVVETQDGFLVAPRDSNAVAAAMRQVANDPALRERLAASFRQHVAESFDRDVLSRRLEAIYGRAMAGVRGIAGSAERTSGVEPVAVSNA